MPPKKRPRRVMTPVYLDPDKQDAIRKLSRATRVPAAVYLREAVDMMLEKYKKELRGSTK